jgi:hypothetical protein
MSGHVATIMENGLSFEVASLEVGSCPIHLVLQCEFRLPRRDLIDFLCGSLQGRYCPEVSFDGSSFRGQAFFGVTDLATQVTLDGVLYSFSLCSVGEISSLVEARTGRDYLASLRESQRQHFESLYDCRINTSLPSIRSSGWDIRDDETPIGVYEQGGEINAFGGSVGAPSLIRQRIGPAICQDCIYNSGSKLLPCAVNPLRPADIEECEDYARKASPYAN